VLIRAGPFEAPLFSRVVGQFAAMRRITQLLRASELLSGRHSRRRPNRGMIMIKRSRPTRLVVLVCGCLGGAVLGISGCNSNSTNSSAGASANAGTPAQPTTTTVAAAATPGSTTGGTFAGQPDLDAICPKLPVADAQALVTPKLGAAVPDESLGGCTFVLPGNALNDSNLTVAFEADGGAASRYSDDVKGVFSAGGTTVSAAPPVTTPLSGVGDKAVWGSDAGYPTMSALKGSTYCSVSPSDDATQLTIIGGAGDPLPQGTPAQQAQYAQLEGKLCTDLFAEVH
jgi:hypothetical protein